MEDGQNNKKLIKAQRDELERRLQSIMTWNEACLKPQSMFLGAELESLVQGTSQVIRTGFAFE